MTAALGREPAGHKLARGDERTPEGGYRIVGPRGAQPLPRLRPDRLPVAADADAALADGRITPRGLRAHRRGAPAGRLPPHDTPLGGDIGIHGEGGRWARRLQHLDWTFGCVAVTDADLDFLARRLDVGVPVEILP